MKKQFFNIDKDINSSDLDNSTDNIFFNQIRNNLYTITGLHYQKLQLEESAIKSEIRCYKPSNKLHNTKNKEFKI